MRDHISRMEASVSRLTPTNNPVSASMQVSKFVSLASNLPKYTAMKTAMSTMKHDEPSWNYVWMALLHEQRRHEGPNTILKKPDSEVGTLVTPMYTNLSRTIITMRRLAKEERSLLQM